LGGISATTGLFYLARIARMNTDHVKTEKDERREVQPILLNTRPPVMGNVVFMGTAEHMVAVVLYLN